MSAVGFTGEHLEKHPISEDVRQIMSKIHATISNDDFVPFSKNMQFCMKQAIVKDATLLRQQFKKHLPSLNGCGVFRVSGSEPVPFHCSTGPAILLPIRCETVPSGKGLSLEDGKITVITRPILMQPKTDFIALFSSKNG